ncbi:uroporphyrinogen-III C-methyltransferase [Horticoccus luteus]|uniref:uroporphyrinogen-III C-methyltransferase n=1 Tax=Horticoccus luteus TaxID=2862869 RepID=A0A8F9TUI9_9BACT|nr:uroporphyrinogen-III C-methyltransferase [Horticoccus luteus]QYM78034.1 uroporphyrinogen-III C-methyltransferase [Horticoccus luteus]
MFSKEQISLYDQSLGRVTLVGAGPGDPELITVRGQRALREAEVVIYDDLANPELLKLCPTARAIYVGKRAGRHCVPQEETTALLVAEAQAGHHVVRLKGGDPLMFGRGGEEAHALAAAGIPCEIVPGVTAAIAAGAAAGVPLTHRDHASAVVFVTGHECAKAETRVDWAALAKTGATLCIYMGARRLPQIAAALTAGGLRESTPVAVVTNASLPTQEVRVATLGSAGELAPTILGKPALIIVGEVVRLAEVLTQASALAVPASGVVELANVA